MDKDLYQNASGELKLKLEGGKLIVMLDTKGVDVSVALEADYFIDKLAEVIPGQVDDAIFAVLKGALKI